jgi:hypothetical protein
MNLKIQRLGTVRFRLGYGETHQPFEKKKKRAYIIHSS